MKAFFTRFLTSSYFKTDFEPILDSKRIFQEILDTCKPEILENCLGIIQKSVNESKHGSLIIREFLDTLLLRLQKSEEAKEQIMLLRVLCLFHGDSHDDIQAKIEDRVLAIYEKGTLSTLTTQSYVDMLKESSVERNTNR